MAAFRMVTRPYSKWLLRRNWSIPLSAPVFARQPTVAWNWNWSIWTVVMISFYLQELIYLRLVMCFCLCLCVSVFVFCVFLLFFFFCCWCCCVALGASWFHAEDLEYDAMATMVPRRDLLKVVKVHQVEKDAIIVCYENLIQVVTLQGNPKHHKKIVSQLNFDFTVDSIGKSAFF